MSGKQAQKATRTSEDILNRNPSAILEKRLSLTAATAPISRSASVKEKQRKPSSTPNRFYQTSNSSLSRASNLPSVTNSINDISPKSLSTSKESVEEIEVDLFKFGRTPKSISALSNTTKSSDPEHRAVNIPSPCFEDASEVDFFKSKSLGRTPKSISALDPEKIHIAGNNPPLCFEDVTKITTNSLGRNVESQRNSTKFTPIHAKPPSTPRVGKSAVNVPETLSEDVTEETLIEAENYQGVPSWDFLMALEKKEKEYRRRTYTL
jgi:hypothetical protein